MQALVLSGGIALGAFEAGLYAALQAEGGMEPDWLLGASAGAVTAAIIAGNPPEARVARLRQFWLGLADAPLPGLGPWRDWLRQASVLQTLALGRAGLFAPWPMPAALMGAAPALYDLAPLRARLLELVDFDRLNGGAPRLTVSAVDLESGERLAFDTGRGDRITVEHILGSCALLPLFAPVAVQGRMLADGGLAANAPLDLVLAEATAPSLLCLVAELFPPAGQMPRSLKEAVARAGDLAFGNQTERLIEGHGRALRLAAALRRLSAQLPGQAMPPGAAGPDQATLLRIGYHPPPEDAGPGKLFDFTADSLALRWQAGERGLRAGLACLAAPPPADEAFVVHRVEA
ncbi:hypothetical protein BKE38_19940 [Pseudoroseomonas deserti]|uniref:PNPLA domain-containing protein n=1 Tax=Teichococcus deserti TaxID=1817963 RepID=A0A1V2GY37_9PROT|nr:patatin-like phospholipase family protein [Pseudoroseomonas deserti]ONG50020.1 hypothetical protein BKE38_19940 [Pseudoroseomonas deserti]